MIDVRNLFRVYSKEKSRYYEEPSLHVFNDETYEVVAEGDIVEDAVIERCLGIKDDHENLVYTSDIVEVNGVRRLVYADGTINWGGKCIPLEEVDCKTLKIIGNEREHFDLINGELL